MVEAAEGRAQNGILGWIERSGNKLPDPVFLFFWLIAVVIAISLLGSLLGWSAVHPTEIDEATGQARVIAATSLLSAENIQRLWVEMPATFTHFHPLGYVLVVMLGAGVAERAGLFGTAMRAGVRNAPTFLLTPIVAFVGMMGNLAADAAYVVLIPLAGIIFHAAGRHPVAGIAAAFAGVSGGFSANLLPGQLDALLFGITEASVETVFGDFTANIAGNWYFIAAMTVLFLPVIWYVTDRMIEPRLGAWNPGMAGREDSGEQGDRHGRRHSGHVQARPGELVDLHRQGHHQQPDAEYGDQPRAEGTAEPPALPQRGDIDEEAGGGTHLNCSWIRSRVFITPR